MKASVECERLKAPDGKSPREGTSNLATRTEKHSVYMIKAKQLEFKSWEVSIAASVSDVQDRGLGEIFSTSGTQS